MPAFLTHAAAATLAALLLLAAGQPIFAEDTWWHLAMGAVYAAEGPWLAADPMLHTAAGPPAPAAWLADVTLYGVERVAGFAGLRVLHAACVAAILALAWSSLRRASGSAVVASLGASGFGALAAYRLFQLRPELFTILAALLLIRLLVAPGDRPGWGRVAGATALMALWANLHAGFVLGPALLAAAAAGSALAAWWRPEQRVRELARARRLAAALGLGLLATLANPSGSGPHRLYFAAGGATPDLAIVADEWARLDLFALPVAKMPPSPLAWALAWIIAAGVVASLVRALQRRPARPTAAESADVDLALGAVALASFAAMQIAVRFLWLGIFPLWLAAQWFGARRAAATLTRPNRTATWVTGIGAVLLIPAFVWYGDWPMISQGVQRRSYVSPYPAAKFNAHAVWFLRDAGLEGNLWNDYISGNFLGYWLAPRLRTFVNGSLNVPKDVMKARQTIEERGWRSDIAFTELLDRYGVDVFYGTGTPVASASVRAAIHTTTHLEGTPGWKLVFRNLRSAIYLRDDAPNAANLGRVADYYARAGVPFDPERGLEVARVLREAPDWAAAHGVAPAHFTRLEALAADPVRGRSARSLLAAIHAALGDYEAAEALDRRLLRLDPGAVGAARRRVWSLLHLRRGAASLAAAETLAAIADPEDALAEVLVEAARGQSALSPADAAARVATLPVFTPWENQQLFVGVRPPETRIPDP